MTTATSDTAARDAERYLKDLTPHLAGLPAEERADLLEDLAQHLHEIAAEPGPPLAERLGSPEAYAAELLASAGVATDRRPPGPPLLARLADLADRAKRSWVGQEAVRLAPALRPAWWVARGYLAVSLLATLQGDGSSAVPLPELAGNTAVGLLAMLAAVALSVRLGQRALPRSGRLMLLAANAVLAVYAISVVTGPVPTQIYYVESSRPPTAANRGCLANASGQPITNLYAYDTEGRLLDPVLLYDQDGQPIDNLCPEVDSRGRRLFTEYSRDVNGAPVVNAFPRRQSAAAESGRPATPGRPETTTPVRPPAVVVPRLAPTTTVAPG
jgi:hypothetical protein